MKAKSKDLGQCGGVFGVGGLGGGAIIPYSER